MRILRKILYKISIVFRIKIQKHNFFTKDNPKYKKYQIGEFTYGFPEILFEDSEAVLRIGKYCSIADGVTIFLGGNHRTDWISTYPFNVLNIHFPEAINITGHPSSKGNVIIENDVWIGRNVTIMSGVTIANGSVIGAESVVTKNIGPYEIWAGNPAKFIRKRFDNQKISHLQELKWWDKDIKWVRENVRNLQTCDFVI